MLKTGFFAIMLAVAMATPALACEDKTPLSADGGRDLFKEALQQKLEEIRQALPIEDRKYLPECITDEMARDFVDRFLRPLIEPGGLLYEPEI